MAACSLIGGQLAALFGLVSSGWADCFAIMAGPVRTSLQRVGGTCQAGSGVLILCMQPLRKKFDHSGHVFTVQSIWLCPPYLARSHDCAIAVRISDAYGPGGSGGGCDGLARPCCPVKNELVCLCSQMQGN
jgi:hypothetical protein